MIKAVADKIVVELMRATKTKGGLVLPESAAEPQAYGKVLSVGEDVFEKVKEGDMLIFHPRAGMDLLLNEQIFKVLKYEELYGFLQDEGIEETLEVIKMGKGNEKESKIVTA